MMDGGRDQKDLNIGAAGHHRRKIGGGTAARIACGCLSSFTSTSIVLSTMRGE
jgi:hypothetical protein